MTEATFAIPGDLSTPTGGYAYDREILRHMGEQGVALRHLALPEGFPFPTRASLDTTAQLLADAQGPLLIDGLAFGALPTEVLARVKARKIALVHHPLALETGLSGDVAASLHRLERKALKAASSVIVTSDTTAATLVSDYEVPPDAIAVAVPGTEQAKRAAGSGTGHAILAVGSVVPRKGYEVLVEALGQLRDRPWSLTIVGATDRAPDYARSLRAEIDEAGLSDRIRFTGGLPGDALALFYDKADIFVLASHYEGFGMVLTEALARGLPIVSTTGGAAAKTVPDAAALKVPPGNAAALAQAVASLLDNADRRCELGDVAFAHARTLPGWSHTAAVVAAVLRNERA